MDVFGHRELGSFTLPVVVMTAGSKRCGQQVSIHVIYGLKHRNNMSTWIIVSFTPSLPSHCRNLRRRRGQQQRGDSETHGVRWRVRDGQRLAASRDSVFIPEMTRCGCGATGYVLDKKGKKINKSDRSDNFPKVPDARITFNPNSGTYVRRQSQNRLKQTKKKPHKKKKLSPE